MLFNDSIANQHINVIKAMGEAWNRQDIEQFLSYFDNDIYWDDSPMEEPARGLDAIKDFALSLWGAFPDMRYIPLQHIFFSSNETKLAHQFTISGTMLGRLSPGFYPTGRYFEIDGLEVVEFRNGKIYRLLSRVDMVKVAEQLGLFPARPKSGSWKARIATFLQCPIAWYLRVSAREK
jgi:predicted ester cyclase